jgi:hypothetical protein
MHVTTALHRLYMLRKAHAYNYTSIYMAADAQAVQGQVWPVCHSRRPDASISCRRYMAGWCTDSSRSRTTGNM